MRIEGLDFELVEYRVQGLGSEFRVQGSGCWVEGWGSNW